LEIHSGEGWRLRVDPNRHPFAVLIGSRNWAAELTLAEARQLHRGVRTLMDQWRVMVPQLMPEEELIIEHAGEGLWLELSVCRQGCALRFVLEPQGHQAGTLWGLEGGWDPAATEALIEALETIHWGGEDH